MARARAGAARDHGAGPDLRQLLRQQPAQPRARSAAGSASRAPTGSSTPIAAASGSRSTPPRPAPPSSRSSTAICAAGTCPHRRGSGSRSGKAATSSGPSGTRTDWPLDGTEWRALYLTGDGLAGRAARRGRPARLRHQDRRRLLGMDRPRRHGDHRADGAAAVGSRRAAPMTSACSLAWRSGGAQLRAVRGVVRVRPGPVTTGWLKASLRALDPGESRPFEPVPTFTSPRAAGPWAGRGRSTSRSGRRPPSSAPGRRCGWSSPGRWLWPLNPLTGQFPAAYQPRPARPMRPALGTTTPDLSARPGHFPDRRPTPNSGRLRRAHGRLYFVPSGRSRFCWPAETAGKASRDEPGQPTSLPADHCQSDHREPVGVLCSR